MADILKDKTNKALIPMSVPISIGMLSTFLFQVVDTYFVGQIGANALAALSFLSTIYFLLVGLFIGLSVGVSIIVGQATGENDLPKVLKTIKAGVLFCVFISVLISALLIFLIDPIFVALGATEVILPLIRAYTVPLLFGIPLLTTGILIGGVLRATGNVTKPEVLMVIAGVINLFFDYALIFGKFGFPELGIKGAAYATVLSWIFVILGMIILLIKDNLFSFAINKLYSTKSILSEIRQVSSPTVVTQIVGPLTLMYLTFLLARESSLAVAAFGVAGRIETLLMIGILGVGTALTPFIAQNRGAEQRDRVEEAIAFGGRASTYLGVLVAVLLFIFIEYIATIFSDNTEVISYTSNYFYIVSLSYVLYGLYLITTSIFNGLKRTVNSLRTSLIKSLVFTIPLTLIGSMWEVQGIFIGLALSHIFGGLYASYEMRKEFRRTNSALKDVHLFDEYKNDFKLLLKSFKSTKK